MVTLSLLCGFGDGTGKHIICGQWKSYQITPFILVQAGVDQNMALHLMIGGIKKFYGNFSIGACGKRIDNLMAWILIIRSSELL